MTGTAKPARFILAGLLCLLPAAVFSLQTERLARFSPASGGAVQMEVVSGLASVALVPGVSTAAASAALEAAGFSLDLARGAGPWHPVYFLRPVPVSQALAALRGLSSVVAQAEPDKVYAVKRVPNDPYLNSQYALPQVQAFGAWEYETGSSSRVTVAVIDTGIEGTHPEFSGKFADSASQFCDPGANKLSGGDNAGCVPEASPGSPTAVCFHGTAVAGVAAAQGNNAAGVAGMSWGARLVSMRVFRGADCSGDCGNASCDTDDWAMADALNFLASKHNTAAYGKIVANLSLGCPVTTCGSCNPASVIGTAVSNAAAAGVMIFAAAGNGGDPFIDTPADCPGIIAVGATDAQDKLAFFSSTDSTMTYKGIAAPGVEVFTATTGGGYTSASGTSFSSPMAAGLAALLWSAKPSKTAADIWDYMRYSADDLGPAGPDRSFGWGRINALKAMRLAQTGSKDFAGTRKAVAYPNPFRPAAQRLVSFTIPDDIMGSGLEVKVYTSEGELVRKLSSLAWDGKNEAGVYAASGVYVFRVKTDRDSAVGKLALIR